jgi:hypothetical protein
MLSFGELAMRSFAVMLSGCASATTMCAFVILRLLASRALIQEQ